MNSSVLIILIIINYVTSQRPTLPDEEDVDVGYYWRGYDGKIPEDAFPGGQDKDGNTTYIGQTSHGSSNCGFANVVVTGHINEEAMEMKYEWGYRKQVARYPIQILCTRHPEQFEWIETNNVDILKLTDRHLVSGGREKNFTIYVGRVKTKDEIAVGKVIVTDVYPMEGFYTVINNDKFHIKTVSGQSYEVLAYNPKLSDKKGMTSLLVSTATNSVGINTASNSFLLLILLICTFSVCTKL
ncbi:hypothetical protein ILUMI_06573 [Ignelater luminosus]|uniref:Uncharacterized protein n=1 Tax=Ignelater luminosus TaxID=2038154 RepID=A0A8K0D851_IGNLU|nr:hypothetical protein ILUMI_06573 [Ignelater luminosus]